MFCLLTVRQLKPGSYEAFREAWQPAEFPSQFLRAYHLRNQEDPDEVASFGFFEATAEEVEQLRDDPAYMKIELDRMQRIAEFELAIKTNGVYEVVEEVLPPGR
jgi:hypothetical protein